MKAVIPPTTAAQKIAFTAKSRPIDTGTVRRIQNARRSAPMC